MTKHAQPTITVCTSVTFYKQAVELGDELGELGYNVILPHSARVMQQNNDFERAHYQTWHTNPDDYPKKAKLMRMHFDEITNGDAILVLNYEKHGRPNYIGGNVLMEMALAFYQQKPIFILNEQPEDSAFLEEILGVLPVFLHGKLEDLPAAWEKLRTA